MKDNLVALEAGKPLNDTLENNQETAIEDDAHQMTVNMNLISDIRQNLFEETVEGQ